MSKEKDQPQGGVELDLRMDLYCAKHKAQMERLRANNIYMANAMMSAMFEKAMKTMPKDAELPDVVEKLGEMSATGPACCYIGQDAFDQILADAPATSGDEQQDFEDAAYAVPGVRPISEQDRREMPEGAKRSLERARAREK